MNSYINPVGVLGQGHPQCGFFHFDRHFTICAEELKTPQRSPSRTMRVLSILVMLISAASVTTTSGNVGAAKIELDVERLPRELGADHQHIKRSLRQHDFNAESEIEPEDEERGGLGNVDDLITKIDDAVGMTGTVDDVVGKAEKMDDVVVKAEKLAPAMRWKTAVKETTERLGLVKQLSQDYKVADRLSLPTLRKLKRVKDLRAKDLLKFNKDTGGGMRRKIEPFEGIKIPPKQYLESHVGRELQRYDKDGNRLLSAAVIGDGDYVLLISSSKRPHDWVIPKGGWDKGEGIEVSALREVIEEAGVYRNRYSFCSWMSILFTNSSMQIHARLNHRLGEIKYHDGKKGYGFLPFTMRTVERFDDWAESGRYRIFVRTAWWGRYIDMQEKQTCVSNTDAQILVENRPWMVVILKEADTTNGLVKRGELPQRDPALEKFELDMTY
ncbi:NUDIX hydrolase domain-like [Phytophthora cactorum]|nr:NUDIX hydrolase domain-like [Phytophthora cactorum]